MSGSRRWLAALAAIGASMAGAPSAMAQGATATVRVNLPVTDAVSSMGISASSTDFGPIGIGQLSSGMVDAAGPVLMVQSNRPFTVMLAAGASTFGPATKPAADVLWALSPGGPFTPSGTTPGSVVSSASGGSLTQPLYFRMLVSLSDAPGTYQLTLSITLTAP